MKVYIVMRYVDYEGGDIKEVFKYEADAEDRAKQLQYGYNMGCEYCVEEWEVKSE